MSRRTSCYEFGAYRLDPLARVLSLRDRPIALAPKTFDLLLLMVERRGRVVERVELIRELWPDTIVEEANLTFQVSTLRKALGEDGSTWIETVPKHGYRFMAPVREVGAESEVSSAAGTSAAGTSPEATSPAVTSPAVTSPTVASPAVAAPAVTSRSATARRWAVAVVLVLAVALAAVGWLRPRGSREPARAAAGSVVASPLTAYQGWEGYPTLSPDGSQVAFSWDGASRDNLDIYLKLVGPGEPHRLTTDKASEFNAAWSPDGRQIAFLRAVQDADRCGVYLIPALGGPERRLAEFSLTSFRSASGNLLAWTPDGKWLAAAGQFTPGSPSEIWLLSPDTGERRRLTTTDDGQSASTDQIGDFGIAFSPDGRSLALLRYATRSVGDVYLLPLNAGYIPSGPLVRLTHENRLVGGPSWSSQGDRLFYSSGGALGYRTLRMIAIDSAHPTRRVAPVPLPAGEHATHLSTARDRIVYARGQRDTNIWRLPLADAAGNGVREGPAPSLLIASTLDEHNPDFSADGRQVTFTSTRSGTEEIWIANADGSEPTQMTSIGGPNTSNSRWSPDGRTILFNSRRSGSSDLYLLDVATRTTQRLTDDPADEYEPRFSRDGTRIYFVSRRSGRAEVWKMTTPTTMSTSALAPGRSPGPAVQVTRHGGGAAFESADGRSLYYAKDTRPVTSIWRVAVDGGEETQVLEGLSYGFNFAVTAKGIYLLASRGSTAWIERFDFATRTSTRLHTLDRPFWFGFALAPDERSILFSKVDSRASDLMLVENLR